MQPSARGRLRAADVCDVESIDKHRRRNRQLRVAGRYATEFASQTLQPIIGGPGCCGSLSEPQIQNEKLKMQHSSSGCSLRSARRFGYELRTSAAGRLRPADL